MIANVCHGKEVKSIGKFIDLTGQRFGRLVAVRVVGQDNNGRARWLCHCDCGNNTEVASKELRRGTTVSCGCYSRENSGKRISAFNYRHGERNTRLYGVWTGMRYRCNCPTCKSYANYGGRGISVCDEWSTFPPFRDWAMANGYDPDAPKGKCTLDRIDADGNYEPSNCRWVDSKVQNNNRRSSPRQTATCKPVEMLSIDGAVIATYKSISEAARTIGKDKKQISCACRSQDNSAYGYLWRYANS